MQGKNCPVAKLFDTTKLIPDKTGMMSAIEPFFHLPHTT